MTVKQARFVEAYLTTAGGNATQAAKVAGYSAESAHVMGSRLLRHPAVAHALNARGKLLAANADTTAERIIAETTKVAMAAADIKGSDKVKALELLGKFKRLWNDGKEQGASGITVNIGFLSTAPADPHPVITIDAQPLDTKATK